jgi:hypothetical protein
MQKLLKQKKSTFMLTQQLLHHLQKLHLSMSLTFVLIAYLEWLEIGRQLTEKESLGKILGNYLHLPHYQISSSLAQVTMLFQLQIMSSL